MKYKIWKKTFKISLDNELLIFSIYQSKELLLRYSIVLGFGLYFVIAANYILLYILYGIVVAYFFITFFLVEAKIVVDLSNSTISKKLFLGKILLTTEFYYSYEQPLEIWAHYYNNNVDDYAFNYYKYEFFAKLGYRNIKLFKFHDESPVQKTIDFLNNKSLDNLSKLVHFKYRGEVESPKDSVYWKGKFKK